jgi:large subunit ribosomal protein L25
VPGIVFGAGEPAMIELDHNALFFALKKEAFHSSVLSMQLNGKTEKVLLRDFKCTLEAADPAHRLPARG